MAGVLGSVLIDGRDDRPNHLSDWDYLQLRGVLDRLVAAGHVRRVPAFNPLHSGFQEWFLDVETGEIYSLTPSAERVSPVWEKVDVFDTRDWKQQQKDWQTQLGEVERAAGYLAPIRTGRKDTADLFYLRDVLQEYIAAGKIEQVMTGMPAPQPGTRAEWFRDNTTGDVCGLIHDTEKNEYRWEKAPPKSLDLDRED